MEFTIIKLHHTRTIRLVWSKIFKTVNGTAHLKYVCEFHNWHPIPSGRRVRTSGKPQVCNLAIHYYIIIEEGTSPDGERSRGVIM